MNHRQFGRELAASYNRRAEQYRRDDEIEARSENHHRIGGNLRRICRSLGKPIRVLEIGCGTGRYFHWLANVKLLVGTDLSEEMLKRARHPVRADEITAREIRLIPGNIYEMEFGSAAFDFIYCLGVFGYGAALTPELCRNLHSWLGPAGRLYIDAIEIAPGKRKDRLTQVTKAKLLPLLPRPLRQKITGRNHGVPVILHTRYGVERVMEAAGFCDFALSSNYSHSPLWSGVHLECIARKDAVIAAPPARETFEMVGAETNF